MSIYLELYDVDEEWLLLTPCSSCATVVGPQDDVGDLNAIDSSISSPISGPSSTDQITIILPNLIDRLTFSINDVVHFVSQYLHPCPQVSVTHLLIYLLLQNLDSAVTCINNLKLLHTGKQYSVLTLADLLALLPLLDAITSRFSIFQLFISSNLSSPAITLDIESLLAKTTEISDTTIIPPAVTYAEAMVRSFKRMRRSLSVVSSASRRASRTLTNSLQDSSTDVEDVEMLLKTKLHRSWRRCFRRASVPADVVM